MPVDTVILTALQFEKAAVVAALGGGRPALDDGTTVHQVGPGGHTVAVVPVTGVGPDRAAQAAQLAIDVWSPLRLVLVGIAAGVPEGADDLRWGDVLLANQVVGYDPAKLKPSVVERRWEVFRPDHALLETAAELSAAQWAYAISTPRPDGSTGRVLPRVHIGPVLSGSKIVADIAAVAHLRSSWPKTIGVEMEGIGVALAAYRNRCGFLVVKAVSDFADSHKADEWHAYAAAAAGQFVATLLRRSNPGRDERSAVVRGDLTAPFVGSAKLQFCQRIGTGWRDLAALFAVPSYQEARFPPGDEPREIWHWLEDRGRLHTLPGALRSVGRPDLADTLTQG